MSEFLQALTIAALSQFVAWGAAVVWGRERLLLKWLAIGALVLAVLGPWLGKLLKRRRIELEREELRQEVYERFGLIEIKPRSGE